MMARRGKPSVVRARLHRLLDDDVAATGLPVVVRWSLIVLIVCNLAASVMESVPWIHERYEVLFTAFEIFSLAIFAVEFAARVWVAPEGQDFDARSRGARLAFL